MKKVISILVSVMMILTAMPAFADGTEAAAASVDIYEALDNFSAEELATTYTSSSPYTTANGFKAPTTTNFDVTLHEDDEAGDFVRLDPATASITGGALLENPSLNIGSGTSHNNEFTASLKFRRLSASGNLYLYLMTASGKIQLLRFWNDSAVNGLYWYCPSKDTGIDIYPNQWYELTVSANLATGKASAIVDGGAYDNYIVETTITIPSDSLTYTGLRLGYEGSVNTDSIYDVAYMSLSNTASIERRDNLTFENGTYASSMQSATEWTSGQWSTTQGVFEAWQGHASVEDTGLPHGKALKLMRTDNAGGNYEIRYTVPSGMVGSNDIVVIETSYKAHNQGQPRIYVQGTGGGTNYLLTFEDGSVTDGIVFGDAENTVVVPVDGRWMRLRFVLDLKNDKLTFSIWPENDPADITTVVKSDGKMADYSDLTSIRFYPYNKTWTNPSYKMYMDDFKVYKPDTLRYIGSNPVNGGANAVSVTANPSLFFNMPIASTTAAPSNVTLTDSKGNAVAGTVGLSAQRNGISFYPDADLKPEETYTLTANCAVTDEFGSTVNVSKTITFTTEPLLSLVNFEFTKDGTTATEVTAGNLSATIEVKSKDKLARNIYAAVAIYDKITNELVSINTDTINAVSNTFNLSATVPSTGTYYAKAFVWNTEALAAPYFTVETLGLSN